MRDISNRCAEVDPMKMKTMLVCSLLDMANLPISERLLEDMEILEYAVVYLDGATLHFSDLTWKTIHPKCDLELLSYLYDPNDKRKLLKKYVYIKSAADSILGLKNQDLTVSVIETIYTIPPISSVPFKIAST